MKFALILISLFFGSLSFAGDTKNNGGDVIICTDSGGKDSYQVYDIYEGTRWYKFTPRPALRNGNSEIITFSYLEEIISRLEVLDPERAVLYRSYLKGLLSEFDLVYFPLDDIRDEGIHFIPTNCRLAQAAMQLRELDENGKKYYFNWQIFSKLSSQMKAALYMHEFIYREGLQKNPYAFQNSQKVRYLTAFLFSTTFLEVSPEKYHGIIGAMGLK